MAMSLADMSNEDINNFYSNQTQTNKDFQNTISTPAGMAAYDASRDQRWSDIQNHVRGYEDDSSWIDHLMDPVMEGLIKATPYALAYSLGDAAFGAAGLGGLSTTGSAGSDLAASSLPMDSSVGSLDWMDSALGAGGTAAGTGGATAAGAAASAIPQVVVTGSAGGAGLGAGTLAAGAAGLGGLGAIASGGGADPSIPQVVVHGGQGGTGIGDGGLATAGTAGAILGADAFGNNNDGLAAAGALPALTSGSSGNSIPESSLPPLVMPTTNPDPAISNSDVTGNPSGTGLTFPSTGGTTGLPGLGSVLGGIGQIGSAITDYQMNNADKDYYQNLLNQMTGMYQPGTPEATLMEKQMDAKDAAAGRNSQYGVRATNLAGMLAQQRANIMTSPTYANIAEASRGHYDNSLNSIFGALGSASTSGTPLNNILTSGVNALTSGNLGSTLSNVGSSLSNLFSSSTTPPVR